MLHICALLMSEDGLTNGREVPYEARGTRTPFCMGGSCQVRAGSDLGSSSCGSNYYQDGFLGRHLEAMRESLEGSPGGVASQEYGYLLVTPLLEDFTDARMGLVCGSQAFHAHLVDRAVTHVVGQLSVQYEGWVGLGAGHGKDGPTD